MYGCSVPVPFGISWVVAMSVCNRKNNNKEVCYSSKANMFYLAEAFVHCSPLTSDLTFLSIYDPTTISVAVEEFEGMIRYTAKDHTALFPETHLAERPTVSHSFLNVLFTERLCEKSTFLY